MKLTIKQHTKDICSANFVIEVNQTTVGEMKIISDIAHWGGDWTLYYAGQNVTLTRGKEQAPADEKCSRPYDIRIEGQDAGSVYQIEVREGGLLSNYSALRLRFNGAEYTMYSIGFGEDGLKNPVYCGGTQVAEIHKACAVKDDLHTFDIYLQDQRYGLASVILCCLDYELHYYKNGEKVIAGITKAVSKTTNKYLLEKYNAGFMAGLIE